jgi:DNA repair exonuclease SbcCD ATPase subunit
MAIDTAIKTNEAPNLVAELEGLRTQLNDALEHVSRMREAYAAHWRESAYNNDAKFLAMKQQLEIAEDRVAAIKTEIAEKERLLDGMQGREADENRWRQRQEDFEVASRRLAETRAELEKLTAEYRAMPDKIGLAEWRFHEALRGFNKAKTRSPEVNE